MALIRHFAKVCKSGGDWIVYEVAECDEGRFVVSPVVRFAMADEARHFAIVLAWQIADRYVSGDYAN